MRAIIKIHGREYRVDFSMPIDLSIPIMAGNENVNAFYIDPVTYIPFQAGSFVGDVNQGGSCNVNTITINPHGNGTHTETVGHISKEKYPIRNSLNKFFFYARVVTLTPEIIEGDSVLTLELLKSFELKTAEAALYLREEGVKHLLLDVPSIDKEDDGGKLSAHHAFWNYPASPRVDCTITELMYVDDEVADGIYLLELQYAAFDNDASPSRPILYRIEE